MSTERQREIIHEMIMREYDGLTRNHRLIDALWAVHDALRQENLEKVEA